MKQKSTSQLYVCELSNGMIKVGRSRSSADSRLRSHKLLAKLMGETAKRSVVYECKTRSNKHEATLIKKCVENGGRRLSKEWFNGISFEKASELARECSEIEFEQREISVSPLDRVVFDLIQTPDYEWAIAVRHSQIIQSLFVENGIWVDEFDPIKDHNISGFQMFCALYLYENDYVANFYQMAVYASNSHECEDWTWFVSKTIMLGIEKMKEQIIALGASK